jgi:hypothetical protein
VRTGDCLVGVAVVSGSRGAKGARQPTSRDTDSCSYPHPGPPHVRTGDCLVGVAVVSGSRGAKGARQPTSRDIDSFFIFHGLDSLHASAHMRLHQLERRGAEQEQTKRFLSQGWLGGYN